MELDDLKKQWKETTAGPSAEAIREAIERKIPAFEKSGRGIRRAFWVEMLIVGSIYLGFLVMLWFLEDEMPLFMWKVVILVGVATVPIVWRLYKSQRWVNSLDYSMDVRSNIVAFVRYYKRTLWMYEWGSYLLIMITVIIVITDPMFDSSDSGMKWIMIGYMILISLLTRPYVHFAYGRKLSVFEDFLKE